MTKNIIKKYNKQSGFTIIETMISVSLFVVVVMAGMGALLNANLLQQKSQDMRSIMDNLSFIMEDMSRNLRTGYNYHCFVPNETIPDNPTIVFTASIPQSCPGGNGWAIAFEQQDGTLYDYNSPTPPATPTITGYHNKDQWVYYIIDGKIFKSTDGAASFIPLTPDEVVIKSTSIVPPFSVSGAEPPKYNNGILVSGSDLQQPFVTIKLVGTISSKGITTPFSLQTSVSQRRMDRGL